VFKFPMRLHFFSQIIFFVFLLLPAPLFAEESLCFSDEQVIFTCTVKDNTKVVSLCASKKFSRLDGFLMYRFGRIGKVELEFPSSKKNSLDKFRYAHYLRAQVDRIEVTFTNAEFHYTVFYYYEGESDIDNPEITQGLRVWKESGYEKSFECGNDYVGKLTQLENIIPCDAGNVLAMSCD
jgi:hypothetical protein